MLSSHTVLRFTILRVSYGYDRFFFWWGGGVKLYTSSFWLCGLGFKNNAISYIPPFMVAHLFPAYQFCEIKLKFTFSGVHHGVLLFYRINAENPP